LAWLEAEAERVARLSTDLSSAAMTAALLIKEDRAGDITADLKSEFLEPDGALFWSAYKPLKGHLSLRSQADIQRGRDLLRLSEALLRRMLTKGKSITSWI